MSAGPSDATPDVLIVGEAWLYAGLVLAHVSDWVPSMTREDLERLGWEMVLLGAGDMSASELAEVHRLPLLDVYDRVAAAFDALDDGTAEGGLR